MNLYHIHIGKCAGGSLNKTLIKKKIHFEQFHCGSSNIDVNGRVMKHTLDDYFIITLRDPIDRLVSSFNFDKFEKTIEKKCENPLWSKVYKEFYSINELVESLISKNLEKKSLACKALFDSNLHMHMGLSWYLDFNTISHLPKNRTCIIRTEYFAKDIQDFSSKLNLGISKDDIVFDKSSNDFLKLLNIDNPKYLSKKSIEILTKLLYKDYLILDELYFMGLIEERYLARKLT